MLVIKNTTDKKRYNHMNIKLKIIKIRLEFLRSTLHLLLYFNKPTDKIIVFCSQQLDQVIVKYYKVKITCDKASPTDNISSLNYTLGSLV